MAELGRGKDAFHLSASGIRIPFGGLTFLIGHNGSGKTLFCRALAGEVSPSRVAASYTDEVGRPVKLAPDQVGLLRQRVDENLALELTPRENLVARSAPLRGVGAWLPVSRSLLGEAAQRLRSLPRLERTIDRPAAELSQGQRQILALGLALTRVRRLLVLDEFLSNADPGTKRDLLSLARKIASGDRAVLVVSHDPRLVSEQADHVLALRDGSVIDERTHVTPEEAFELMLGQELG